MRYLENGFIMSFPKDLVFTDDEFFAFCQENAELNIERDKHNNIIIMSPSGTLGGNQSGKVFGKLFIWNEAADLGLTFESSTGFTLPDKSVRSPDAAWVSHEKWNTLTQEQKEKFAPICPEFIVEVKSPSDSLKELQAKMLEWVANGIQLGWLLDPKEEKAFIYTTKGLKATVTDFSQKLSGENVLPGFEFDLSLLKM